MSSLDFFANKLTPEEKTLYGLTPVEEGGHIFCACEFQEYSISGVTYSLLPLRKITWGIAFSRLGSLSHDDCRDVFATALKEISDSCDMQHEWTSNPNGANLLITSRRLDGTSGVLADCSIPVGNITPATQLLMRLDDSEGWVVSETPRQGQIDLYRVFLHEAEHGHGLGHKPANIASPALISPMYSATMRNLQAADKGELTRRYGPSKAVAPPPSTPAPGGKPIEVSVSQDGKTWSGSLPRTK